MITANESAFHIARRDFQYHFFLSLYLSFPFVYLFSLFIYSIIIFLFFYFFSLFLNYCFSFFLFFLVFFFFSFFPIYFPFLFVLSSYYCDLLLSSPASCHHPIFSFSFLSSFPLPCSFVIFFLLLSLLSSYFLLLKLSGEITNCLMADFLVCFVLFYLPP